MCEHREILKIGKGGNCKYCSCFVVEPFAESIVKERVVTIKEECQ